MAPEKGLSSPIYRQCLLKTWILLTPEFGCEVHKYYTIAQYRVNLLPTESREREVLGVGNIPVVILPSCQDMKTIALWLRKYEYSRVVKIRNTSEAGQNTPIGHHTDRSPMGLSQYKAPDNSIGEYCDPHTASSVFLILVSDFL